LRAKGSTIPARTLNEQPTPFCASSATALMRLPHRCECTDPE